MTSAFSSPDAAVLEREADLADNEAPEVTIDLIWGEDQSKKCMEWIRANKYKRVCLQFPDSYLKCSEAIASSIKDQLGEPDDVKTFILADTSYGSCCVDEIAAAHVDADSLVHFGNACRSKVCRLPVLYCFPQLHTDLSKFNEYVKSLVEHTEEKNVTVYLDIGYHQLLSDSLEQQLVGIFQQLKAKQVDIISYCGDKHAAITEGKISITAEGELANEMDPSRLCLFVGGDNQRFFNLSLTTKAAKWFIYDTYKAVGSEKNPLTANYIRRRYFYIEKCKDAQMLGLVVATLTSNGYLDVVKRLQTMAKARGIKTQIISVGRINPAKLANFLEIDCFVLIGCPFNNMFESKEFYKPIVSVFEAEMALNPAWHMRYPESYVTDFMDLLPAGRCFLEFNANDVNPEDVSLLTGRLRSNGTNGNCVETANLSALSEQQQSVATQARMEMMTTNTGLTFEDRTWRGLNPALGQTEPAKLEKGLSGIPIRYTHD
ncbi:2-(3-amino-3-carboxypropyl)histidine synthase subunit 2 [Stomoxys calcitrans]|uniref:2-(3-amino-3-carboxypropyl)histidine synthase subunit 2 n=1 Tax=Stomoxys calcitrans TaxID=35570 RepID=A0A1I8PNB5_STOCA|nr:2-(3-amino-3-carboxypropyl)histidine synthase subunit 2 [Stomoxys calcitrans]